MKMRLEVVKGRWLEVLLGVLWAYRTTSKTSTRETLFSLVYRNEALIAVGIREPSPRFKHMNELSNNEKLHTNLDLAEK